MKIMVRYRMNLSGKSLTVSAFFAGLSFFLCVLHYYVLGNVESVKGWDFVLQLLLPMIVLGVYMLLIKLVRLDIPLVYGALTLLYCVYICTARLTGGPDWLNVVEVIWYVLCCAALVVSMLGYLPGKWFIAAAFFLAAVARVFLRDFLDYFKPLDLLAAVPEIWTLSGILSLSCLCAGLKARPVKKRNAERV